MIVATKGMVGFATLIAAGLTVAHDAPTRLIRVSPAAQGEYFFGADAKADFNELRQNELRRRARAALQTLIEKQAASDSSSHNPG